MGKPAGDAEKIEQQVERDSESDSGLRGCNL